MKKNSSFKSGLFFFLFAFVSSVFIYLFTVSEIKVMNKKKDNLENLLTEKINAKEMALVEIQKLSTEDRIVRIARDSIGLVRSTEIYKTIYLEEDQVYRVNKIVESKYE